MAVLHEFEFEIHSNDVWNDSFLNREVGFSLGGCLNSDAKLFDVDTISLRPVDYIVPMNSYSFIFGTSASEGFCDNTVFTSGTFVFFIEENISCIVNATRNLPDPVWKDVQIQTVSCHNIQLFVNEIS